MGGGHGERQTDIEAEMRARVVERKNLQAHCFAWRRRCWVRRLF